MYGLNKIVGLLTSPVILGMGGILLGLIMSIMYWRRLSRGLVVLSFVWLLFWMSPATYRRLASGLEKDYPVVKAEDQPQADAIMVLGGGMARNTKVSPYSEMWMSADRAWHGARLYKARKATNVFVTCKADIALLTDLGVPRSAINAESAARNTEEEARFIAGAINQVKVEGRERKARVLVVTSAWHMRRALLMFEKYAPHVEAIPAATDHEALMRCGWKTGFGLNDLIPDPEMFSLNCYMLHELIGYWGYKLVRR